MVKKLTVLNSYVAKNDIHLHEQVSHIWLIRSCLWLYFQTTAPVYDLHKMEVPTIIYWGSNDWLAAPQVCISINGPKIGGSSKFVSLYNGYF